MEYRLRRKDGAFRWFLVRAEAMRDADGAITKWFGTNTDIDELKNAQNEAERSSRAKDAFLATLSHELRTPLAPVLLTAAALRDDPSLPAEARATSSGMIERNNSLEARLIDDLLDLTAVSRGEAEPPAPVLATPTRSSGSPSRSCAATRWPRASPLERTFSARRSGVTADPARFQQIIWNLLRNAVKFTPAGGRIAIATSDRPAGPGRAGSGSRSPTSGIGIDPAALERIFLPFEQGPGADGQRFGGMGLPASRSPAPSSTCTGGRISAQSGDRTRAPPSSSSCRARCRRPMA